ncbi:hypothetical protein GLYMA_09G154300v4 [Glycine max]|uniref:Uncharacterized protein n=2 Tax=Glycine subgen. Soja TaxID=1462606 RepID=K7LE40_SOYBN|nr:hypothetical protein GYH30_025141 [Glycine max]KHN27858.1 hypothetical protein glysoja_033006 [Glycine soja]KRH38732.1 hypothetical protein GLYMA_09G154300v4 [Glycine max]
MFLLNFVEEKFCSVGSCKIRCFSVVLNNICSHAICLKFERVEKSSFFAFLFYGVYM